MRKGEALYTYFMKAMAKQERDKDGKLVLILDESNAIDIVQALYEMPDDIFDKILNGEQPL